MLSGEEDDLDGNALEHLLLCFDANKKRCIQHLYFFNPNASIRHYLDQETEKGVLRVNDDYKIVYDTEKVRAELDTLLNSGFNIIASGFSSAPDKTLFSILPTKSLSKYYFFQYPLSAQQRVFWENNHGWVEPYSIGLGKYIRQSGSTEVQFDVPANFDGTPDLRPDAIREVTKFIQSDKKRICILAGLRGIGKDSFISELQSTGKLTNVLRFDFNPGSESWFSDLCELLLLNPANQDSLSLDKDQIDTLVGKIIDRLQRESSVNLVFKNAHQLLKDDGELQESLLFMEFIRRTLILSRKHANVRFWLLSEQRLDFYKLELDDLAMEVRLDPLSETQTMKMLYKYDMAKVETVQRSGASAIFPYVEKIQNLTGGHPGIIKLFSRDSKFLPLEEMVSDPLLVSQFKDEKASYIRKWLRLTIEEETVMSFLALLPETEAVELDAIREFQPNPIRIVKNLAGKFILEVVHSDRVPTRVYRLPSLFRDFLMENMKDELRAYLRGRVDRYLQNRLEP